MAWSDTIPGYHPVVKAGQLLDGLCLVILDEGRQGVELAGQVLRLPQPGRLVRAVVVLLRCHWDMSSRHTLLPNMEE